MTPSDDTLRLIAELKAKARSFREPLMEFQGLEREFVLIQEDLIRKYKRSSPIQHPGDLGAIREEILRDFLSKTGYLPLKYGVSKSSVRVVSQTGHQTEQIDIAIYDALNSPTLVNYSSLAFLAIESVYGVIQVKSRIGSRKDVNHGLKNIASFKGLKGAEDKFGILFAYECQLKWVTLVETVEKFMLENSPSVWPNFIVILNQGLILPCEDGLRPFTIQEHYFRNSDARNISKLKVIGLPDTGSTIFRFYLYLMELLSICNVEPLNLYRYAKLPFTSGKKAYDFTAGEMQEVGHCPSHGNYLRKVSHESINKIIDICSKAKPTNLNTMFQVALGQFTSSSEDINQHQNIYIYNPDNLPLSDALTLPQVRGLTYYSLTVENREYIIPMYYSFKDSLISECPKCNYPASLYISK